MPVLPRARRAPARLVRRALHSPSLRALRHPSYRLWAGAGLVSVTGSWMQLVAQSWLVLSLTGSTAALGLSVALQAGPTFLLSLWGGGVVDRFDRRRLLLATQAASALSAAVLAGAVALGVASVGLLYVLAVVLGVVRVVDGPAAGVFGAELVPNDDLPNAIALGSVSDSLGRVTGLALAGVLVAVAGPAVVFGLNAVSFVPVLVALAVLGRRTRLAPARERPATRASTAGLRPPHPGAGLRPALAFLRRTPALLVVLAMAFVTASFGRNYQVTMAAMTDQVLHAGAGAYGLCSTAFAAGAFVGALLATRLRSVTAGLLVTVLAVSAVGEVAAGLTPGLGPFVAVLVPIAACAVVIDTVAQSLIQLEADPALRGRLLAVLALAGTAGAMVGAPLLGAVADHLGGRAALVLGGGVVVVAAATGHVLLGERRNVAPALAAA